MPRIRASRRGRARSWLAAIALVVVLLVLARIGHAEPGCAQAARGAEQQAGLPESLLLAVGRVESGRRDLASNTVQPWPWTVNAQGAGHFFDSAQAAIQFVRDLQARGVRSIDVGCFQVNLFYHPQAFASLEDAFSTEANAAYAARFLSELRARTGEWPRAVAFYHSAEPAEGESYRRRVYASLSGDGLSGSAGPLESAALASPPRPYAFMPHRDDPVVVLLSAAASRVAVLGPASARQSPSFGALRLPRVFTPSLRG